MKYNKDTGEKILNTAISVFEEKGYSGTRMQEIADKAGINKALLHYYYKSKERMFQIILERALNLLMPKVVAAFKNDYDLFTSIEKFVSAYIDTLIKHPHLPGFVLHELSSNPNHIVSMIKLGGVDAGNLRKKIQVEIDKGTIESCDPNQLILNILSLCIFPFVAKPIFIELILDGDQQKYKQMIETRKKEVSIFIIKAIRK
jgi:AcrR family transcriptional regulator